MKKLLLSTLCLLGLSTAASAVTYSKVTDASTLKAGDKIIVVGAVQTNQKNYAMGNYADGNNCPATEVSISDNKITDPSTDVAIVTLETGSESNKWALSTSKGYLYAANTSTSNSKNYLKAKEDASNWTIEIDPTTSYATMTCAVGSPRNVLRYNNSNNSNLFSCYASGQNDIYIFREDEIPQTSDPTIIASPSSIDFGTMIVGSTPEAKTVTITGLNLTDKPQIQWNDDTDNNFDCSGTLTNEGGELTISIASTASAGTYENTLNISANGAEVDINVTANIITLDGTGEGTLESPYDVARALCLITNNLYNADESYYVKGIITGTPQINTSSGIANYNIKDAGDTTEKLYIYKGYYNNDPINYKFTSTEQIKEGDEVVVCGKMKVYNSTPELDSSNYIVTLNGKSTLPATKSTTIEFAKDVLSMVMGTPASNIATVKSGEGEVSGATVTYSIEPETVATIDATTGIVTPVAPGIATVTATFTENEEYLGSTATYTLTVSNQAGGTSGIYYFGPDWNALFDTAYTGSFGVTEQTWPITGSVEEITISVDRGTSTYGYIKTGDLRLYKGTNDGVGYTMTLTAPTNYKITAISSTVGGKTFTEGLAADTGNLSIKSNAISWTGSSNAVVLTASGTVSFATITVSIEQDTTGLAGVAADDADAAAEYFNLQGVRVGADAKGLVIVKQGGRAFKQLR